MHQSLEISQLIKRYMSLRVMAVHEAYITFIKKAKEIHLLLRFLEFNKSELKNAKQQRNKHAPRTC